VENQTATQRDAEDDVDQPEDDQLPEESDYESDSEILNDLSSEKAAAYEWVTDGCPALH